MKDPLIFIYWFNFKVYIIFKSLLYIKYFFSSSICSFNSACDSFNLLSQCSLETRLHYIFKSSRILLNIYLIFVASFGACTVLRSKMMQLSLLMSKHEAIKQEKKRKKENRQSMCSRIKTKFNLLYEICDVFHGLLLVLYIIYNIILLFPKFRFPLSYPILLIPMKFIRD